MSRTIAFDGTIFGAGPITGVAGTFLTTLREYAKRSPHRLVLLVPRDLVDPVPAIDGVEVEPFKASIASGAWLRTRALRKACRRLGAALLHSPITAVPARCSCPVIATVHDIPWLYRQLSGEPGARKSQRIALELAIRTAAAIIVPSRATLADLKRACGDRAAERTHVIHHGIDLPEPFEADRETRWFLLFADRRPRKNELQVRHAMNLARRTDPDCPLVHRVNPDDDYVSEELKLRLLRDSMALINVSLLEGFGMTVLEAFAHGVPVICSDRSSLLEIAGDAALLVDPEDVNAIAEAMVRMHRDSDLRAELRQRGLQRAREFSVDRTAQHWRQLHEQLTSG